MIIKVQISKTWQEKQYEPFNVQLGAEQEVCDDTKVPVISEIMQIVANNLQDIAEAIYAERKASR